MKNLKISLLISILAFVILSCNKQGTITPNTEIQKDSVSTPIPAVDSKKFPEEKSLKKVESLLSNDHAIQSFKILGWREISESEVLVYYHVTYDNSNRLQTTTFFRLKNKDEYIWILIGGQYEYSVINKQINNK